MKHDRSLPRRLTLLLAGIAVVGLAFAPRAFPQTMGDMREMMQGMMGDRLPPGIDPTLLPNAHSRGVKLLERYCTQCHQLPGPGMHTAAEWPAVVARMNTRMQMMGEMRMTMMGRIVAPTPQEIDAIDAYLMRYAQKPIAAGRYPLNTPAGKAFEEICSQCHALPDPSQHAPQEWSGVVARMKQHEAMMGRVVPDFHMTEQIVGFLQQNGRPGQ